jgi:hypothetical protein
MNYCTSPSFLDFPLSPSNSLLFPSLSPPSQRHPREGGDLCLFRKCERKAALFVTLRVTTWVPAFAGKTLGKLEKSKTSLLIPCSKHAMMLPSWFKSLKDIPLKTSHKKKEGRKVFKRENPQKNNAPKSNPQKEKLSKRPP